jgi:RHS repeat-associated protein
MDFGPYGEQLTSAEGIGQKVFAQITFDGESAMDYAEARMFQLRTGRFNAADPVFDAVQNPQKWNRYSYGLNNPQMFVDPGGRNAASGVEDPWSSFCGAEHSFSDCGGDRLFWADAFGGGG